MQFMAFLKDSLREARNGWVLQAMLVLSALLVLFVASISFTPTTPKDMLGTPLWLMNSTVRNEPNLAGTKFAVENTVSTNEREPWKADYSFDFVVTADKAEQISQLEENPRYPANRGRVQRFVQSGVRVLENVKARQIEGTPPNELRFRVTTQGTKAEDLTAWPHEPRVLFAIDAPLFIQSLRAGVFTIENYVVGGAGAWIILFISVILTSGFIPNLLQKGSVDLAISKPLPRWRLLVYKYLGGLTFTAILTTFTVGGAWLVLGLRTGMWNWYFLLAVPLIVAYFAVLYAVSTLVAVLTRSGIVAILATLLAWGVFFAVGKVNRGIEERERIVAGQAANPGGVKIKQPRSLDDIDGVMARIDPDAPLYSFFPRSLFGVAKAVHAASPRTYQIDLWLDRLIARGILTGAELRDVEDDSPPMPGLAEVLGVSLAFIVLTLGLASWRFETRSY